MDVKIRQGRSKQCIKISTEGMNINRPEKNLPCLLERKYKIISRICHSFMLACKTVWWRILKLNEHMKGKLLLILHHAMFFILIFELVIYGFPVLNVVAMQNALMYYCINRTQTDIFLNHGMYLTWLVLLINLSLLRLIRRIHL